MKKIDPKKKPESKSYSWSASAKKPDYGNLTYSVYNWIAYVARGLPLATFEEGPSVRDGKTHIIVRIQGERYECTVEDDDPTMVVKTFKDNAQPRPYS